MSVIRQKPFIEELISSLSIENIKEFRNLLNEGGDNVKLSFATLTNAYKNKVTPVYFELDNLNIKTALLVWSNTLCALVCYHRFQDILLIELNTTNHTYKKVNEYCDINELRRIVDDVLETKGAEILVVSGTSGELTDAEIEQAKMPDTVLRAGDDGAFYYKESQSEDYIVFKAFPRIEDGTTYLENITIDLSDNTYSYNAEAISAGEGFSPEYDTELNNSSTNAPQTKVVNAALEDKANVDGNYPTMTAGLADNLTPYSEDSGAEQDDPFISEGTGTGNGSEIVTTGDYGLLKEKQGNSVVVNQYIGISTIQTQTLNGITLTNNADGTYTLNGTATDDIDFNLGTFNFPALQDQKFLGFGAGADASATTHYLRIGNFSDAIYNYTIGNKTYGNLVVHIDIKNGATLNNVKYEPKFVWLTQWFGSNDSIPSDLLTNPSHFSWYYNGDLSYNTGELKNSDGVKLVSTGRNLWDEEWEVGGINITTGQNEPSTTQIRSKNYIKVISEKTYYFYNSNQYDRIYFYDLNKNYISQQTLPNSSFTTPNNCDFVRFMMRGSYGSTYNNDITISLYYTSEQGGEGYEQYYPYEEPKVYNTGTETLRSAGSVRDVKTPDGTITRKVGSYTFAGNESWTFDSDNNYFYATIEDSSFIQPKSAISLSSNGIFVNTYSTSKIIRVYLSSNPQLTSSSNLRNYFVNGTKMNYPLLTPTTEQGTSFSENLQINDYGMLYWLDADDELVGIPQGNKIFYPVNYKGFIDDVYARTDGDASKIVIQSELSGYVKQVDLSSGITSSINGLTFDVKKAYKIENQVFLTIRLQNSSGSTISANSNLLTLSNDLTPAQNFGIYFNAVKGTSNSLIVVGSGVLKNVEALNNNEFLYVTISYAVA